MRKVYMRAITGISIGAAFLLAVSFLVAQERKPQEEPGVKAKMTVQDSVKKMTKTELIKEINTEIADEEEILDYTPNLKMMTDAEGKECLGYNDGGIMVRLEDLDRGKLESILNGIYNKAAIISAERVQGQLEQIRQIENITRQTQAQRGVPAVPTIPQQPPRAPYQPPAEPPRTPPSPPRDTNR